MRALDIAATGMQAQQTNVEVIANNIANMTTTGYQRQRVEFQDLLYQDLRRAGSNSSDAGTIVPSGTQIGLGVKTAAIYRIDQQGNLQQTNNSLDLAISGNGWFQVTLPSGQTAYTRDGTFGLSPSGEIVTADGYIVQPGIQIPSNATNVTINASGQVQVSLSGQTAPQTVGQLQLAAFPNDAGLEAQGGNLLIQTAASGSPVTAVPSSPGFGSVQQGFVENSNVNVVSEITDLITAQRAYEMNSKVITTSNQMLNTLTQL
ncbi:MULTISPECIES: flagellar basal-body rod protein FlgG [Acidiphilium]|jgi:flagellar basal-body rod protein FlgG|uniref:Flagellar basal-body rod protein FlgG n=1 Tax=Acidiphilium rubrum TaxID=526 RepID=A0A8G2CJG7_ACIRU|nr:MULTISPECIES: flagellar basal-body rod protein FlgG [Acidiphilium]MBW4034777.1 flagellar basal-body rod protein FlgG [Pseudomonadota bacterium]OYW02392.1 MAG: flagellar basal-body rod protein FlgG [Acidiphilium sp. 37-64-53]OZB30195.1 MAG: flagellar basal-body rod protein FlgG [Acidiphilium sp. 34-64-41]SIQ50652.1 flagellar basal-body rod protein FlgG [Acidiphilium rubrum]HQT84536.1 flagellar basal-body rod protein FlgG [Acidiphilium rubrum]